MCNHIIILRSYICIKIELVKFHLPSLIVCKITYYGHPTFIGLDNFKSKFTSYLLRPEHVHLLLDQNRLAIQFNFTTCFCERLRSFYTSFRALKKLSLILKLNISDYITSTFITFR
jgi:hypothetical protein